MLQQQIKQDATAAMKAGDQATLRAARNLLAAFTNELVAQKKKPRETIDDDNALAVVGRLAKQRKDSILQFRAGGREDLVKAEEEELAYLEQYLPAMMEKDEIRRIVEAKKKELGIVDASDMGKLMGAIMPDLKGKVDGGEVRAIAQELLS